MAEYNGKTLTLKELSAATGLSYQTLIWRWSQGVRGQDLFKSAMQRRAEEAAKRPPSSVRRETELAKRERLRRELNEVTWRA
jgi:hypothetical protein